MVVDMTESDNSQALAETRYLEQTGTGAIMRQREKDDSGWTNIDDIDWEKLWVKTLPES